MSIGPATASLVGAFGLLERAVGYTRSTLQLATSEELGRATPCPGWDLRALLLHLDDSLVALQEAADVGYVDPDPTAGHGEGEPPGDISAMVRARTSSLLGAWSNRDGPSLVSVAGRPLTAELVASTGALEVAVHGWDVARACGNRRPVPPLLAEELLELVPLLVTDRDRPSQFAAPVDVPAQAAPGDRLVACLGRRP